MTNWDLIISANSRTALDGGQPGRPGKRLAHADMEHVRFFSSVERMQAYLLELEREMRGVYPCCVRGACHV